MRHATKSEVMAAASAYMHLDSLISFDDQPMAATSDAGVWVRAWVFVEFEDCEKCGGTVTDLGQSHCHVCQREVSQ